MNLRHWFRRDVILPLLYLILFGAILYALHIYTQDVILFNNPAILIWLQRSLGVLYVLLVVVTVSHVLSTYDLERYDPGNLNSLKRLMKRQRYRLSSKAIPAERVLVEFEAALLAKKFRLERDNLEIGRVYVKRRLCAPFLGAKYSRLILLQHEPLNIFMVDKLLQNCIRYIRNQTGRQSKRNLLVIVTRMQEAEEVASCGAGVVNFLGKFQGGTLGVVLLSTSQKRLFYPADRTILPRTHRLFQDFYRLLLKRIVFHKQKTG